MNRAALLSASLVLAFSVLAGPFRVGETPYSNPSETSLRYAVLDTGSYVGVKEMNNRGDFVGDDKRWISANLAYQTLLPGDGHDVAWASDLSEDGTTVGRVVIHHVSEGDPPTGWSEDRPSLWPSNSTEPVILQTPGVPLMDDFGNTSTNFAARSGPIDGNIVYGMAGQLDWVGDLGGISWDLSESLTALSTRIDDRVNDFGHSWNNLIDVLKARGGHTIQWWTWTSDLIPQPPNGYYWETDEAYRIDGQCVLYYPMDINKFGAHIANSSSGWLPREQGQGVDFLQREATRIPLPRLGTWTVALNSRREKNQAGVLCDFFQVVGNPVRGPILTEPEFPGSTNYITHTLSTLDPTNWPVHYAYDINDLGVIAAAAHKQGASNPTTVLLIPADLAVDANRDGYIKFAGNVRDTNLTTIPLDRTGEAEPFRFWVNDDHDAHNEAGGEEVVPALFSDCQDDEMNSVRDMEDFARLRLHIGGLCKLVSEGKLLVGLRWTNVTGTNAPSIKVFQHVETNGGTAYLTNMTAAEQQRLDDSGTAIREALKNKDNQHQSVNTGGTFIFNPGFFSDLSETNSTKNLLFEGCTEGKGELVITLHNTNGTEIGEGPGVWLDIMDIRKMYQSSTNNMFAGALPSESQQTLAFVHGWNMSLEGSRNYAETMFKRLWHRGFKGRFAYFRWNTDWSSSWQWLPVGGSAIDAHLAEYNNSEFEAWTQGAPALKTFVEQELPANHTINIAAHSMGNIVASEALRLGMAVNNYALMQAAVPAACYDADEARIRRTSQETHTAGPLIYQMWDSPTPDEDDDASTQALAYRGTFQGISTNANLISFYLSEDYATSFAWEINNDQTKPPMWNGEQGNASLCFNYEYNPQGNPGQKLWMFAVSALYPTYYITNKHEAMAYACRTWGKAAGAWGATAGAISANASVNLGDQDFQLPDQTKTGFGEDHSGQFNANIQSLKPFYDELINKLQIGPANP